MTEPFSGMTTLVLKLFYAFESASMILFKVKDKAVLSNHWHVRCFDSIRGYSEFDFLGNEYVLYFLFGNICLLELLNEIYHRPVFRRPTEPCKDW